MIFTAQYSVLTMEAQISGFVELSLLSEIEGTSRTVKISYGND